MNRLVALQRGRTTPFVKWMMALSIASTVVIMFLVGGCVGGANVEPPQDTTQRLFVAQWSLTGATNAVADLRGVISDDRYEQAKKAVLGGAVALNCAKAAADVPGAVRPLQCPDIPEGGGALAYLNVLQKLLLEAAKYYAAAQPETP